MARTGESEVCKSLTKILIYSVYGLPRLRFFEVRYNLYMGYFVMLKLKFHF